MAVDSYFALWAPIELTKGGAVGLIQGIASSERRDLDGEEIDQDGLDWSYFKANGFLSYQHPLGVVNIVGEPVALRQITAPSGKPATAIDGRLYLNDAMGKAVWEKAVTLSKAGTDRRLGFSIEGSVVARDPEQPKRITKARVISVAIDAAPKNPDALFEPIMAAVGRANFLAQCDVLMRARAEGRPAERQPVRKGRTVDPRLLDGLSDEDLVAARILREVPRLSWDQARQIAPSALKAARRHGGR